MGQLKPVRYLLIITIRMMELLMPKTGVAWLEIKAGVPYGAGDVRAFTDWRGGGSVTDKVPSVISYDLSPARYQQWGYSIDPSSTVFQWTKLELKRRSVKDELDSLVELLDGLSNLRPDGLKDGVYPQRHYCKSATEVVEDFLMKVARYWRSSLSTTSQHLFANIPIDLVISHPAVSPSPRHALILCIGL